MPSGLMQSAPARSHPKNPRCPVGVPVVCENSVLDRLDVHPRPHRDQVARPVPDHQVTARSPWYW